MSKHDIEQINKERAAIRAAMLQASSDWSAQADKAWATDTRAAAYMAENISGAFTQEAGKYKPMKEGDMQDKSTDERPLVDEDPTLAADEDRWGSMLLEPAAPENQSDAQRTTWEIINEDDDAPKI